jgi:hypothetical protein
VVELARLESVYAGNRIKGSNPFSSASFRLQSMYNIDFDILAYQKELVNYSDTQ